MTLKHFFLTTFWVFGSFLSHAETLDNLPKVHGIAMHQELKYAPDFKHFDYAKPDAQKGGSLKLHVTGNFDSLNPYLLKGNPAPFLMANRVYGSLMKRSKDEPFSLYGFIAESVQMPEDRSFIVFHINPKARFEDQTPITADDVIFTFNILKEKSSPHIKMLYNKALKVEKLSDYSVKLILDTEKSDRETPLLLAMMPVLSQKFFEKHAFEESSHVIPLSSGSYKVKSFSPGKEIIFERVQNFWADDLPTMKGHNNFQIVQVSAFRDSNIALEAFKSGAFDLIHETDFAKWEKDYDVKAVSEGKIKKIVMKHNRPMGMFGIALNMRRSPFDNENLRKGLITLFDHQWVIENYYNKSYVPSTSFFSNCEFEAKGEAEGKVKAILETYQDKVPSASFSGFQLKKLTSRERLKEALHFFEQAGWVVHGKDLVNKETKKKLEFEVLIGQKPLEKIALCYANMLSKAGITMHVRYVDSAQFTQRKDDYDFDVLIHLWGVGNCPGKDLQFYWTSEAADKPGTRNYPGIKNPVIDDLIEKIIAQKTYNDYLLYVQALDRVLMAGNYLVPLVYWNKDHFAYWDKFVLPNVQDPLQEKLAYLTREDWALDLWEASKDMKSAK